MGSFQCEKTIRVAGKIELKVSMSSKCCAKPETGASQKLIIVRALNGRRMGLCEER